MSPHSTVLRTLAFGDVERTVWGAAWIPDPDGAALTTLGDGGERTAVSSLRLSAARTPASGASTATAPRLIVSPAGDPVDGPGT